MTINIAPIQVKNAKLLIFSAFISFLYILGTEDVDIARCLRRLGVYPNKSIDDFGRERFHPLSISGHYNGKKN